MVFSLRKKTKKDDSPQVVVTRPLAGGKKPVRPVKPGSFKTTSGAKFALLIGDEGAILVHIIGKKVQSRNFIPDTGERNLNEFSAVLAKDPKAPLYLIIDSMDQSFVQQTLPPVSSLNVNKLIKHRLERDFGPDIIKGAVLLERDKTGRKDWNFLMVSLDKSPQLLAWLTFIDGVETRLKGIYLLSVEAEIIINNLDRAMGLPKESTGSRWKFFVTHNKVGGFRQVILRDGKIIFTRLAQPVGESTPEVIAGNIEQEMASTIEYMRRLSFNPQEGLDLYIIASADINNKLDTARLFATNVYKFTPFEVAEFMGIEGATQPTDQFGDVVLATSIASSRKHRLILSTPQSKKVEQIYAVIQYQYIVATFVVLGCMIYTGMLAYNLANNYVQIEDLEQKKNAQQRMYDELKAEIGKNNIDVKKTIETVELYKQLLSENISPMPLIKKLNEAVRSSVRITDVVWNLGGELKQVPGSIAVQQMTMVVNLKFPELVTTPESFKVVSRKVLKDIRAAFPGYEASYTVLPPEFIEKETQDITFDEKQQKTVNKAAEAKVTISGPVTIPAPGSVAVGVNGSMGQMPFPDALAPHNAGEAGQ